MRRFLAALVLLSFAAPVAAEVEWSGIGWYILVEDEFGWLGMAAGPYSEEKACKVEEARYTAAHQRELDPFFK